MDQMPSHRLLLVHAHPDDETINNGATMAGYLAQGAAVTLVTCTRGEEGEVLVPSLSHHAAARDNTLGTYREGELAAAMAELGVTDFQFLGTPTHAYRDSGMMGTPPNEVPESFWQADLDQAAMQLLEIIRDRRPQVLITYDDFGGYGHPDHIKAHRVAMRAAELAADPSVGSGEPWEISKIYWSAIPRSALHGMTTKYDGEKYLPKKLAALKAHKTQLVIHGDLFKFSKRLSTRVNGTEYYIRVKGDAVGPYDKNGRELDLFAGVTE
eukprot:gene1255-1270_t